MLALHAMVHRHIAGVGTARAAIATAAACIVAALLSPMDAQAQRIPVQITGFGPFTIGMTVDEAKTAAPRAKQEDCGEIAEDRQCLAMRAAVFNEPAMLYAVLDEEAKRVGKIVARLNPYGTHRRAFRCVRLSEKVFALLAVVYGSEFKQSYDEERRPLPAVAWDGIREGRLIFETNCETQDEGAPTITVVPMKQPGAESMPDMAIGPGAADAAKSESDSPWSPPTNPMSADENVVFEPGVDTGLSIDEPEPKPDTAPLLPVTKSLLPPMAATPEQDGRPGPKVRTAPKTPTTPDSQPKPEAKPKPGEGQTFGPPVAPRVTTASEKPLSPKIAADAPPPPKPTAKRTEAAASAAAEVPSPAPKASKTQPSGKAPEATASPTTNPSPEAPETTKAKDAKGSAAPREPRAKPVKPEPAAEVLREPRARQLAHLSSGDSGGEFELPSVSAPEPFDYADDDETDTLGEFVMPVDRTPSPLIVLLRDPSAAPSVTDAPSPVQTIVADAAAPATARSNRVPANVTAPNLAEGPKAAGTAVASPAPAAQSAKPVDRPKRVWRSTRPPVSLLPTRREPGDKAADPKPDDTFGPVVSRRGAGESVIEIRSLSNASESGTVDGSHRPGPADQPLDAIVSFSDPETPAIQSDAKSPAATRSANLASLERATQRRAAPKHDGAATASTLTARDNDAKPRVLVRTATQGETSRPRQRIAAKTPGSGNGRPETPAAAPSVPTANAKVAPATKTKTKTKSTPPQDAEATHKDKDTAKANETSAPKDNHRTHRVARDETVFSISMRYKVDIKALVRLNKIPPSNKIVVGQTLIIPDPVNKSGDVVRSADRDAAREPDRNTVPRP